VSYRSSSPLRNLSLPFSREPYQDAAVGRLSTPLGRATLSLVPFLALARELAALFVPIQPRAEFRAELERNLMAAARQQIAHNRLLCAPPTIPFQRDGRRWVWGAATVGSAVSLASIVAYVWFHRHRQAA
jgi:hypothetical protein